MSLWRIMGKPYLSGFYETAVESKHIPVCFLLLAFLLLLLLFVGRTKILKRIHLGLLYALEESRHGLGA